jgi:hypothetical protein
MTQTINIAPVNKSIEVNVGQARAFEVFTGNMSKWWPASHTILKAPLKETIVEPRKGGRWYQIGEDGSECGTGHVMEWDPPARVLLCWSINGAWQYDPDLVTEVEVRFIAEGPKKTRVELEHRHIERMGATAEAGRAAVDSPNGWGAILESFRASAEA